MNECNHYFYRYSSHTIDPEFGCVKKSNLSTSLTSESLYRNLESDFEILLAFDIL